MLLRSVMQMRFQIISQWAPYLQVSGWSYVVVYVAQWTDKYVAEVTEPWETRYTCRNG
jgi:hypothetical protein